MRIAELLEEQPHAIEIKIIGVVADDAKAFVVAECREESQGLCVTTAAGRLYRLAGNDKWLVMSGTDRLGLGRGSGATRYPALEATLGSSGSGRVMSAFLADGHRLSIVSKLPRAFKLSPQTIAGKALAI
jgi:hypothetical protein